MNAVIKGKCPVCTLQQCSESHQMLGMFQQWLITGGFNQQNWDLKSPKTWMKVQLPKKSNLSLLQSFGSSGTQKVTLADFCDCIICPNFEESYVCIVGGYIPLTSDLDWASMFNGKIRETSIVLVVCIPSFADYIVVTWLIWCFRTNLQFVQAEHYTSPWFFQQSIDHAFTRWLPEFTISGLPPCRLVELISVWISSTMEV